MVSQTVSSLYLSNAEYGTLLCNDKLYDQAYDIALVIFYEQQLILLNTYIYDFQSVADELAGTNLFKNWSVTWGKTRYLSKIDTVKNNKNQSIINY